MSTASVTILFALALSGQIETSRPEAGPLEPRFRLDRFDFRADETQKTSFYLGSPECVGDWVVCSFGKSRGGMGTMCFPAPMVASDEATSKEGEELKAQPAVEPVVPELAPWQALLAFNVETRLAIQLLPPCPDAKSNRLSQIIGHYCLNRERCLIRLRQWETDGIRPVKILDDFLWEWDLDKNEVRPLGVWNDASLFQLVLDPGLFDVAIDGESAKEKQNVEIRDKQTGDKARYAFDDVELLTPANGGHSAMYSQDCLIVPQSNRKSFVSFDRRLATPTAKDDEGLVECIDPRSDSGRRWMLTDAEICKAAGFEKGWIFPVWGLSPSAGTVGVGVFYGTRQSLVLVDSTTGKIKQAVPLPEIGEGEYRQGPILSADGSRAAYSFEMRGKTLDAPSRYAVVEIDMQTGTVISQTVSDERGWTLEEPFELDRAGRILAENYGSIIRFTPGEPSQIEPIFSLDPAQKETARQFTDAGFRALRDLGALSSLTLANIDVSPEKFRELGQLPRLESLELELTDNSPTDLPDIDGLTNIKKLTVFGGKITDAALARLGKLSNLEQIELHLDWSDITAEGLGQFGNLRGLTSLTLSGFEVDDFNLSQLSTLKRLQSLDLGFYLSGSDSSDAVPGFANLRQVKLDSFRTAARVKRLEELPKLTEVDLELNATDELDEIVRELATLPRLTRLRLANENTLSEGVLQELGKLPNLTCLDLDSFGVENGGKSIEGLSACKRLTELHLTNYNLKPDDLAELQKMPNLRQLDLSQVTAYDVDLREVGKLTNLTALDLYSREQWEPEITDATLSEFGSLTHLKKLRLSGNSISDAGLKELSKLTTLEKLQLAHTFVTDSGLTSLGALSNLVELDLFDTSITDAGLKELRALPRLAALDLGLTQITDAGLKELASLPALRRLNLEANSISDPGMKEIGALANLEELDLSSTAVSDVGLKELQNLKNLRVLTLKRTAVTDAGLNELKCLPNLTTLRLGK